MRILFYLLFFLFSLGQTGRISFLNQMINFYLYEVFSFLILLFLFFKYYFLPLKKIFQNKLLSFFIFFLFFSYFLNFFNFNFQENLISFFYLLRLIFYLLFFYYLDFYFEKNSQEKKYFQKGFLIFVFLIIFSSIIQFVFYQDLRNLYYLGWDPHLRRLFGVFFDTSIAGAIYGLIFLFFFLKNNYFFSIIFLIFLVLTFSRMSYLSLLITIIFYFLSKKDWKKIVIFLLVFLMIFFISPKNFGQGVGLNRFFSIQSRIEDYQKAFFIFKKSPVFGFGYNRLKFVKERYRLSEKISQFPNHADFSFSSSFLIILTTTGILGLINFLALIFKLFQKKEDLRIYLIYLLLLSLADNIILHSFIMFLFIYFAVQIL